MPKKIDITGERYGRLTVIEPAGHVGSKTAWKCLCDCGNYCNVTTDHLRRGNTTSCGCKYEERKEDLTGNKYGLLTVLNVEGVNKENRRLWKCQCQCGNTTLALGKDLKRGHTTSCGCQKTFSIGEKNIEKVLKDNKIQYKREYSVYIEDSYKRFDFAIYENNKLKRLIEFDGIQHFYQGKGMFNEPLKNIQNRDNQKTQWCFNNKIPLVRIPYTERDNVNLETLLSDKFLVKEV